MRALYNTQKTEKDLHERERRKAVKMMMMIVMVLFDNGVDRKLCVC